MMMDRCYNPENKNYRNYGGRGITVCDEWHDPSVFIEWCQGNYREGLEIDRRDNDGNYEPGNCRFVTRSENCLNKRKMRFCKRGHELTPDNVLLTIGKASRHPQRQCRTCRQARTQDEVESRRSKRKKVAEISGNTGRRKPAWIRVGGVNSVKTHCPKGHPYDGENLYVSPRGYRNCRACAREQRVQWEIRAYGKRA